MTRQCCVCKRIHVDDRWVSAPLDIFSQADVTHGYCERCYEELKRSLSRGLFSAYRPREASVEAP